ncbi:MAG: nickel pincer cofactor biosynthesis protein LarC [Planctomycetota bacterium]
MHQHDPNLDPPGEPPKAPTGLQLHLDAVHGIAGDMLLGALLDLGVPERAVREPLQRTLPPFDLQVEPTLRRGIRCRQVHVEGGEPAPPTRNLAAVTGLVTQGSLNSRVQEQALRVFRLLAEAEGSVHGVPPEQVHFHEVGAIDSLVDVIGTLLAVDYLTPETVSCSSLPLGSGTVHTAHGIYPVPAPATLKLLQDLPTHPLEVGREVSTPTGVALAKVLAQHFGAPPSGCITDIGYGAGSRRSDPHEPPNLLRAWTCRPVTAQDGVEVVTLLQTNVDHLPGEESGHLLEALLNAGALDVFLTPTIQKKSRPGLEISVLCPAGQEAFLEERLFRESGTLGIRRIHLERRVLQRHWQEIEVEGNLIRVKSAYLNGRLIARAPEYEDLRRFAHKSGRSLRAVRAAVLRAIPEDAGKS